MDMNSSFYIAYKPEKNIGYKNSEISFLGAAKHVLAKDKNNYFGTIIVNKTELNDFFNKFLLGESLDDYLKKYDYQARKYITCEEALANGRHIFIREVDGADKDFCDFMEEMVPLDNVKVLFRDI